ncbi:uroporphyrinogen-III synthase [Rhodospirillaceae bacterium SYSU D60014]|uniref:uroporphyrinogen-III synthase n=1 Tax=Virgifigura deserti TaxID=2268457 RepID=UPI0013C460FA
MVLRALITRPEADAAPVAEALRARGLETTVEPLLTIRPLPDAPLDLEGVQALLFTSANGVRALAVHSTAGHSEIPDLPVFAVGDATAEAARAVGFERVESAAGDVDDLARLVRDRLDPAAGPLLHVAGTVTAGDLAGDLGEAGFELRRAVLYEAEPVDRLSPAVTEALADGAFDLVLFFSPRTACSFVELVRRPAGVDTDPDLAERLAAGCGKAEALCLSAAVAEAADDLPWRQVRTAERPDLPSMLKLVDVAMAAPAETATEAVAQEDRREETREDMPAAESEPAISERADAPDPDSTAPQKPTAAEPSRSANGPWAGPGGPAPLPQRRGSAVALAALVAALIAVAAVLTQPWWSSRLGLSAPPQDVAGAERLAEAEQRLSALDGRLDRIDGTLDGLGAQLTELGDSLAALSEKGEAAVEPTLPPAVEALPGRLDKLERQIADLAAAMQQPPPPAPQTITALDDLRAQTEQLRTGLSEVREQIAVAPQLREQIAAQEATAAHRAETAALMLAAGQLRAALAGDQPFAEDLAALRELAGDRPGFAETIEPLAAYAETGIPTLPDLQATFHETARAVTQASQSEGLAESLGTDPDSQGWVDRTIARLSSLVTVRPVGDAVEGEGPAARVARAEARLEAGDLEAAVAELSNLTGAPAEAAADWLTQARARLAADAAAAKLQTTLVRGLAQQAAAQHETQGDGATMPPEAVPSPEPPPEPAPTTGGGAS